MSDLNYQRCPGDDWKAGSAPIGTNPKTGKPIELDIHAISAAHSIQSCLSTLSSAMKAGHERDFLETVALSLLPRSLDDPHSLCPLMSVVSMIMLMVRGEASASFGEDGRIIIGPADVPEVGSDGGACVLEEGFISEEDYDDLVGNNPGTDKTDEETREEREDDEDIRGDDDGLTKSE